MISTLRSAIITGLSGRAKWSGIDLFAYPAGDLAERESGFFLASARATPEEVTLEGDPLVNWTIEGGLWIGGTGITDTDYAAVEQRVEELITDLDVWFASTGHGKTLTGIDQLYLDSFEIGFDADGGAFVDLTITAVLT